MDHIFFHLSMFSTKATIRIYYKLLVGVINFMQPIKITTIIYCDNFPKTIFIKMNFGG